jgi:hypothetical protein
MARRGRISAELLSHGCDEVGEWYIEIGIRDGVGRQHAKIFSMEELATNQNQLWGFFGKAGYHIPQQSRLRISEKLLQPPKKASFEVLSSQGWHERRRGYLFATPFKLYGTHRGTARIVRVDAAGADKWTPRGDLGSWKSRVTEICTGNPLLAFAVIVSFMAPLLRLVGLPTIGFSLVSEPNLAKSTSLTLSGWAWGGDPDNPLGFGEAFLKTANSFDKVAKRYRDSLLCLDETRLAATSPREMATVVGNVVHRLASGVSKETAISDAPPIYSRLVYMMSSNYTLEEMFKMANEPFDESYKARLIEIGVSKPEGMFHTLPTGMTAHDFARHIQTAAAEKYGWAIHRYLRKLTGACRSDGDKLTARIKRHMSSMEGQLGINGNMPGEARRGQYFCLAYAAARLAARYGVLPWKRRMISKSVQAAYEAHRRLLSREAGKPDPVEEVRRFIESHKLVDVRKDLPNLSSEQFEAGPGFIIETRSGQRYFAFAPEFFRVQFGGDDGAEPTLQALKAAGLLKHDKGKLTRKHLIRSNEERDRVYCVRSTILRSTKDGR